MFLRFGVRKLTGKPVDVTPPDCEFEARRIHNQIYENDFSRAAESKAFRTHSDLLPRDLAIAACISLLSSGESLALTMMPRRLALGTFGLPILVLINTLCKTKITVDRCYFVFYDKSTSKNTMANHLPTEKKVLVVSMLAEGSSIRAIERITGVNRNTIMSLGVRVGDACAKIQHEKMRGLACKQIEIDEIWGFIGKKRKNTRPWDFVEGLGDIWTFIALDVDTKLIPAFMVGQRTMHHAKAFLNDLSWRMASRIQLSSDALPVYRETVGQVFGSEVDYGQIVKTFAVTNLNKDAASR